MFIEIVQRFAAMTHLVEGLSLETLLMVKVERSSQKITNNNNS
jgi:hypothetical protein